MQRTAKERAQELLRDLSLEEKIHQVTGEMLLDVSGDYEERRDPLCGSYRNPAHFMHQYESGPATPAACTRQINRDVELSIAAQPHHIPPIENGEALHGAQWGMCTNFPQPIGLASSFDPEMVERVGSVIGKECSAAGVRQVFSPVVNLARDCRWGRTVETYGEDVKLSADMGAAMSRGLEINGVVASPKHFADNFGAGGRDSNYSEISERTMRETILPPFKACFDAGAQSVMAAYNSWDGIPCSAHPHLLTDILRNEWDFDGFVVSDYGGVEGMEDGHRIADSRARACAMALKAGLDVILPANRYEDVKAAVEKGYLTEAELDRNVLRILTVKFRLGLFEDPYRDPEAAEALVRCKEHKALALKAARESIILLKNEGILPLDRAKLRRIGVFGQSARLIPIGTNYSGPYAAPWQGADAPTPLEALTEYFGGAAEVVFGESREIEDLAPQCDVNLYFTTIMEGEGSDRSDLRLPSISSSKPREEDGGIIVGAAEQVVTEDQEADILRLAAANPNTIVILENGAPIDMTAWIHRIPAVMEAWYPGEQGARALAEILAGETNPSGKLPITFPKSVGQLPLYYSYKPTGRGYAYCDNDGKPLYPFGYGLSYTSFDLENAALAAEGDTVKVTADVVNTGDREGTEVVQLYVGSYHCDVVRPVKELKAYTRVRLAAGERRRVTLELGRDAFSYYDREMRYGLHDGCHRLMLGVSSEDIRAELEVEVRGSRISIRGSV